MTDRSYVYEYVVPCDRTDITKTTMLGTQRIYPINMWLRNHEAVEAERKNRQQIKKMAARSPNANEENNTFQVLKAVGLDEMDPVGRKRLFGEVVGPRLRHLDYYARENK